MEYCKEGNNAFIRLDRGEDLFSNIILVAKKENWPSAHISGIGLLEKIELGLYNRVKKAYESNYFPEPSELLNLSGNLTWNDKEYFLHLHAILANREYKCYGGHIIAATVGHTCEISVDIFQKKINRELLGTTNFYQLSF